METNGHTGEEQSDFGGGRAIGGVTEGAECDTLSLSSNDSFHSTLESLDDLEVT